MRQSNSYIILYSAALTVVCALALAFASISLKDRQDANIAREKKLNILSTVMTVDETADIDKLYSERITEKVVDFNGQVVSDKKASDIDVAKQYKEAAERQLSVQQPAAKQPKYDICIYCTTRASYGNYDTKRRFCKAHMNPQLHWRITFCDKGGCDKVAEPNQSWEGLNLCLDHLSNVVPVAVIDAQVHFMEANPLEAEMQQALLQ